MDSRTLKTQIKNNIHTNLQAKSEALRKAQITLGETYNAPIINNDFARKRALEIYKESMRRAKIN